MSEPFLGEIRMFAGTFAPNYWAFCDGQLLSIQQNTALFSLLGTTYGGDGRVSFALPDLRGRVPMHVGQGPGLSPHVLGEMAGTEHTTLTTQNLPSHVHEGTAGASTQTSDKPGPGLAPAPGGSYGPADMNSPMARTQPAGASIPFNNMQPSLGVHFIIALQGIFPSRPW